MEYYGQQSLHGDSSTQFEESDISHASFGVESSEEEKSKELLSFESDERQVMEAIKSIEDAVSFDENSSFSGEVSPNISGQSTLGEISSDFSAAKLGGGSENDDLISDPEKDTDDSEDKDNNNLTTGGNSSSEEVVTQLWVHRNPQEEQSDATKEASDVISSTLLENNSSADAATDNDVISESSNIASPVLELEDDTKLVSQNGNEDGTENAGKGIEEYFIRPPAPVVALGFPENNDGVVSDGGSDILGSSSQKLDLVWDTDIPSETEEVKRVPVTSYIKQSSQHSLERPSSDPAKVQQLSPKAESQPPNAFSPEIEKIAVFNKTELQPLHRRPVSNFTGTFNDNNDNDSLVETTWDSESVTSQKDLPVDEPELDSTNQVQASEQTQQTPVVETKSDQIFSTQPNLESKLQISISTDIMDCTIKADNLPIKKTKSVVAPEPKPASKIEPQYLDVTPGKVSPKRPIQHSPAPLEAGSRIPVNMPKENEDNPWVEGLRSNLYRKGSSGSGSGKGSSARTRPDKSGSRHEDKKTTAAATPDVMREHMSKLCSQHDHQELHLCCMPPAPSYNFQPRIEQVKREVTKRSVSVDSLARPQRKKYPMTATRRRIPSSNSTTTAEMSSSVFESSNDRSSTLQAGMYSYRPRTRFDSLNNYPSDTESTCSSRIPRYYGSSRGGGGKKELSDSDVKQIVSLVKAGGDKKSQASSSSSLLHSAEIVIKRDPHSHRWQLSSMPTLVGGDSGPKSDPSYEKKKLEDEVDSLRRQRSFRDHRYSENTSFRSDEMSFSQQRLLNNWGFGFFLGIIVAAAFRYILYPSLCLAYDSFNPVETPSAVRTDSTGLQDEPATLDAVNETTTH